MFFWLLISFLIHNIRCIPIGRISNVSLILATSPSLIITGSTKQECICTMVSSPNISALNYFSNNTCQLFSNASLTNGDFSWVSDINSVFYFLQLPSKVDDGGCPAGKQNIRQLFQRFPPRVERVEIRNSPRGYRPKLRSKFVSN